MQQLRNAARLLARTPGFTIVAAITLALGIGVNSAIFSVIDAVLLRPLPYPHPEQLVSFYEHEGNDPDDRGGIAPANMADYNQNHVFLGLAHVGTPGMNLTGAGTPERIFGIQAGYNFLDILGVQPALGAQRHNILGLTMARALGPILAGLAAELAGALAASRLLTSLLFEVKPSDPATFALVAAMLGVVALGACLIPARRATRVDPMVALRYE
jgi:ABC-type antimicrobial peptide transport system permease subunit